MIKYIKDSLCRYLHPRDRLVRRTLPAITGMVEYLDQSHPGVLLALDDHVLLTGTTVEVVWNLKYKRIEQYDIYDTSARKIDSLKGGYAKLSLINVSNITTWPSISPIQKNVYKDLAEYVHALVDNHWVTIVRKSEIVTWTEDSEYIAVDDIRYNLGFISDLYYRDSYIGFKHRGRNVRVPVRDKCIVTLGDMAHRSIITLDDRKIDLRYIELIDDTSNNHP